MNFTRTWSIVLYIWINWKYDKKKHNAAKMNEKNIDNNYAYI